jgi:Ca-activated chloride channel homolog
VDGLRFASPWALWLLLLVPPLAYAVLRRARALAVTVGAVADAAAAPRTWRIRFEPLLPAARLLAVALLVVALARPQRGLADAAAAGNGIDIVLAFDVSASMTLPYARNQTRLDAAKDVLSRFVETRRNDRVGLVVFQATALTLSPLTTDYDAVAEDVRNADRVHLADGTAIGLAIAESVDLLRGSSAASRIVILLTDGENNQTQIQPLAAARVAETLGVRVYTVGVGGGSGMPDPALFTVDERALGEISRVTGGAYNRAEDPAALQRTYDNVDRLERSRLPGNRFTRVDEWSPYLLAAAAALLALELALRHSLFRRLG